MADSRVSDEIAHIFFHVDRGLTDDDRELGAETRHAKLKIVLDQFKTDSRIISRKDLILALIAATLDNDVKEGLQLLNVDDDGQRIRLVLGEWVEKGVQPDDG